jgi:2-C-methyl-D-erythritol 4-phosphate cytidylyltransferase
VSEHVWTIVVAAGRGTRFGGPKQFEMLGTRRIVDWSLDVANAASEGVVVVVPAGAAHEAAGVLVVAGGSTRSDSVRCGLAAVAPDATIVCVHDAARPFAGAALYESVIAAVREGADGAVPGIEVSDTIKQVDEHGVASPTRSPAPDGCGPAGVSPTFRRAHATSTRVDGARWWKRRRASSSFQVRRQSQDPSDDLVWARRLVSS